eukprot:351841-Chlamydomonas_euryale.AAC.21
MPVGQPSGAATRQACLVACSAAPAGGSTRIMCGVRDLAPASSAIAAAIISYVCSGQASRGCLIRRPSRPGQPWLWVDGRCVGQFGSEGPIARAQRGTLSDTRPSVGSPAGATLLQLPD